MSSPEDEEKESQALQQKKKVAGPQDQTSEPQNAAEEIKQAPPTMPKPSTPIVPTPVSRPVSSTPVASRPVTSTPIGSPSPSTPIGKTSTSTPIGKPLTSTPVGRPATSTPVGTAPRPAGPGLPARPTVPLKPAESKEEISRRNFLKVLALAGGLIMVGSFGQLFPFLQGSVENVSATTQVIEDITTGAPIKSSDIPQNDFKIFIWPKTGNPAIDADSFRQCVAIHLPTNLTADSSVSAKDPISGDTFIAFSRVCVHLWCLWNYIPRDERMECPCHGSQYVPGTGSYPNFTQASGQAPGQAVAGPASLQTAPNNMAPIVKLSIASDGTISATQLIGQVGCGQMC